MQNECRQYDVLYSNRVYWNVVQQLADGLLAPAEFVWRVRQLCEEHNLASVLTDITDAMR